jgi:ADP-ribosyl-[dinitrogen reductase] hydrolase
MTAGDIFLGWVIPGLGLAFFAAGAWANAGILLGGFRSQRAAGARRAQASPIPLVAGLAGAIAMWNGPFEWMRAWAWAPLVLDAGCLPYLALVAAALVAAHRHKAAAPEPPSADVQAQGERDFQALAGCLLGTAVGDALGLASEGLSPRRQALLFPDAGRYHLLPFGRGMCSDDTEHTVMVAQSLIRAAAFAGGRQDAQVFRTGLAWRLRWWLLGLPAGIGLATLKGILKLWLFLPQRWQGSFSAGNGPAMRSALIGVYWAGEPDLMRRHVEASTRLTHSDPKATQAALAVAVAADMAAQQGGRVDPADYARRMQSVLGPEGAELALLIDQVAAAVQAAQSTQDFAAAMGLARGVTGYSFHTVPIALHAWLSHPADYRGAVLAAIRCGGDTDTVAAITGAIAGAGCGRQGLPAEWLGRLAEWPHGVAWMDELARALALARRDSVMASQPPAAPFKVLVRNAFFMCVVLAHGFRRLLPPY